MLKNWLSLSVFVFILILLTNFFWPRDRLFLAQLNLRRWPYSVINHLQMAQTYFHTGYENEAQQKYQKAQNLYQAFSFLDFQQRTAFQLQQTEKLLNEVKDLKKQIHSWEEILKAKPFARDVLLQLAVLNYQLYQDEQTQTYWQRAFYLDPNNSKIKEIGKIIEVVK